MLQPRRAAGGYFLFDGLNTNYCVVPIDEVANFRTTGDGTLHDYYSGQRRGLPQPITVSMTHLLMMKTTPFETVLIIRLILLKILTRKAEGVFSPTIHLRAFQ